MKQSLTITPDQTPKGYVSVTQYRGSTDEVVKTAQGSNDFTTFGLFVLYLNQRGWDAFTNELAFFDSNVSISPNIITPNEPSMVLQSQLSEFSTAVTTKTITAMVTHMGKPHFKISTYFKSFMGKLNNYTTPSVAGSFNSLGYRSSFSWDTDYFNTIYNGNSNGPVLFTIIDLETQFTITPEDTIEVVYDVYIPQQVEPIVLPSFTTTLNGVEHLVDTVLPAASLSPLNNRIYGFGNSSEFTYQTNTLNAIYTDPLYHLDSEGYVVVHSYINIRGNVDGAIGIPSVNGLKGGPITTFTPPIVKPLGQTLTLEREYKLDFGYVPYLQSPTTDHLWDDVVILITGEGTVGTRDYVCLKGSTITYESDYFAGQLPGLVDDTILRYGKPVVNIPASYTAMRVSMAEWFHQIPYTLEIDVYLDSTDGGGYLGILDSGYMYRSDIPMDQWVHIQMLTTPINGGLSYITYVNGKIFMGDSETAREGLRLGGNITNQKRYRWANLRVTKGHRSIMPWLHPTGPFPTSS